MSVRSPNHRSESNKRECGYSQTLSAFGVWTPSFWPFLAHLRRCGSHVPLQNRVPEAPPTRFGKNAPPIEHYGRDLSEDYIPPEAVFSTSVSPSQLKSAVLERTCLMWRLTGTKRVLSFAKTPAGFKISKIPQRLVTCYLSEFRRRTQLLRSTTGGKGSQREGQEEFRTRCTLIASPPISGCCTGGSYPYQVHLHHDVEFNVSDRSCQATMYI